MKLSHVHLLRCPRCSASPLAAHPFEEQDERCRTGVLACTGCTAWYPISDFVLELLPEGAEEPGRREEFYRRHEKAMEALGLREPETEREPGQAFSAQVKQREHFDELARREDEFSYGVSLGQSPFWRAQRDLTFGEWDRMVQPGSLLLDIGCADGLSTFPLARSDVEILAFDISREQIVLARSEAEARGLRNVTFFVADADTIPLREETVDGVVCFGSLHHVPDPARTLAGAARALKEGGLYLGIENNKTPLRPIFDAAMRLIPLWKEEAGPEAQIGQADLSRWTAGSALHLESRPIVFVPPHLCNWIGAAGTRRLLRWTNALFGRLPVLKRWGGLLTILGRKLGSTPATDRVLSTERQPTQPALHPLD